MHHRNSSRKRFSSASDPRSSIAAVAARLIAEDDLEDYLQAKKKALRQLGLPNNTALPDNAEVEDAVRAHRALYQSGEHPAMLEALRRSALQLMEFLAPFNPYLTGSVLDGTAGEYSQIDLLLFADSAKEVEIFLLNHGIEVQHTTPRHDKVEAVLQISTENTDANLVILAPQMERVSFKHRDGRVRARIRADELRRLLHAAPQPA
ncbi:hypothetical protein [Azonexus sp.]|uniref:hypothetical protein n=1 Tax=Azonexus sp. TaxID=1872668 RepID=UPI0039E2C624